MAVDNSIITTEYSVTARVKPSWEHLSAATAGKKAQMTYSSSNMYISCAGLSCARLGDQLTCVCMYVCMYGATSSSQFGTIVKDGFRQSFCEFRNTGDH